MCAYGANVAAICLFGGKSLPVALRVETRPAPLRLAVAGVGPSALRGLVFQSPNTIYQSDPFCPRFATIAPLRLSILVSSLRARRAVAPLYAETASGFGEAALSDSIGTGSYLPSVRRLLRRCRGGVGYALHTDHPPDPCAGNAPEEFPALEDGFYRFAAKGTSAANQKPHYTVASSRQGYFAPASRDAILLDGSLLATSRSANLAHNQHRKRHYDTLDARVRFTQ